MLTLAYRANTPIFMVGRLQKQNAGTARCGPRFRVETVREGHCLNGTTSSSRPANLIDATQDTRNRLWTFLVNTKTTLLGMSLAFASVMTVAANAHDPKMQAQEMKGHDMKGHDMAGHDMKGMDMKGHSAGSMEMHKIMMAGMKMPMNMSGKVDHDFAHMMIAHHEQAIKMADIQIKTGTSAQLKALVRKMKADQLKEITQLRAYTK